MKYLLIDPDGVILHISDTLDHQANGNPLVDNGTLAYVACLVEREAGLETVPEEITAYRYCYTDEAGFTLNPNWVEPTPPVAEGITPDEIMSILNGEAE